MSKCDLELTTERLLIKELEITDAKAIYLYYKDEEVTRYIPPKHFTCVGDTEKFIADLLEKDFNTTNLWYPIGVYLKENKQFVGNISLHFLDPKNAVVEIGFIFVPQYQKCGYAIESVKAVVGYLFDNMKKHRVLAWADPRNISSVRLLEKLGMKREAYFRKSYWDGKAWNDDSVYAILQEDWQKPTH